MSDIQKAVQDKYGAIAASVKDHAATAAVGCCGPASCGGTDPITLTRIDGKRIQTRLGSGGPKVRAVADYGPFSLQMVR